MWALNFSKPPKIKIVIYNTPITDLKKKTVLYNTGFIKKDLLSFKVTWIFLEITLEPGITDLYLLSVIQQTHGS